MRQQNHHVCLVLDNFSGHYIDYEPMNVKMVYFAPNLTPWVQPLDAGIICCFKAHYCRRFCGNALKRDDLGEADIYNIDLLQVLQMATAAWEDITPETIKNCWKHTGIQREPLTVRLPAPTLKQQGWCQGHSALVPAQRLSMVGVFRPRQLSGPLRATN